MLQKAASRRLAQHTRESGVFDRHTGRPVRPKRVVALENYSPRITTLRDHAAEDVPQERTQESVTSGAPSTAERARTRLAGYSY